MSPARTSRAAVVIALVLVACSTAPKRSAPTSSPRVPLRPAYIPFVDTPLQMPRPAIAVATVTPETNLRRPWPLTELPSLQPHHDFAMARDLCSGEWAQRNKLHTDLVAYGAAWCQIRARDDRGLAALATLARSSSDDVKRAARLDVVNLVAGTDPDRAMARLRAFELDAPEELDLLAAIYGALDMREQALAVAVRASREDAHRAPLEHCERTLAWSRLDDLTDDLSLVAERSSGPCAKRAAAVWCAIEAARTSPGSARLPAVRECYNEFPDDADADRRAWLVVAFFQWSSSQVPAEWLALSRQAENALGLAGAEDLAVTALERAVRVSACEAEVLRGVAAAAFRVANHDRHEAAYEKRLDALRSMTDKRCMEWHE